MTAAIALAHVERPEETALDRLDEWHRSGPRNLRTEVLGRQIQIVAREMRPREVAGCVVAVPVVVATGIGRGTAAALSDLAERGAEVGVW